MQSKMAAMRPLSSMLISKRVVQSPHKLITRTGSHYIRVVSQTGDSDAPDSKTLLLNNAASMQQFISLLSDKQRVQLLNQLALNNSKDQLSSVQVKDGNIIIETSDQEPGAAGQAQQPVTMSQYRKLCLHSALPFVGFGFLDNLTMIVAGDYIDTTLGVTLGISTMVAAGLGNAVSDVVGIQSAFYVENICSKLISSPNLTAGQKKYPSVQFTVHSSRIIGIVIGCLLGMFPLFISPTKRSSDKEDKGHQDSTSSSQSSTGPASN